MASATLFAGARRPVVTAFLFAALLLPTAHGADKKATEPAPPPPKTPLMTQAQLRDCLAQKDKLTKDTEAAVKSKAALAAQRAEIDSTGKALEEEAATLDRTSEDAVVAYNAKVIERKGKVDAYRAKAEAYNTEVESVITTKEAYEKACVDRRYDERDLNDLQKKK